jgi:SAM-dependent methyltransferase
VAAQGKEAMTVTSIAGNENATTPPEPQWFTEDFARFSDMQSRNDRGLALNWEERQPCLADRTPGCGFDRHYVYHTAWAARVLAATRPAKHIDISSSLYFCAIASAFVPVDYYEYRPVNLTLDNLTAGVADLRHLPFADHSVASISCMHVVEHIGLGRYGDPIDPDGDLEAMAELRRVLAPGGSLLFVVPVGRPRVVFNAHRIYGVAQIRHCFRDLELRQFALIPDGRHNRGLMIDPPDDFVNQQNYGCGCFWFQRSET